MYSYEKFAQLLADRGVRAAEVARRTGISQATFTSWRKGLYEPREDKIQKLADYFGVSPAHFYDIDLVSIPLAGMSTGQAILAESGKGLTEAECRMLAQMILAFKQSKEKDA